MLDGLTAGTRCDQGALGSGHRCEHVGHRPRLPRTAMPLSEKVWQTHAGRRGGGREPSRADKSPPLLSA
eukprot:12046337-Alexandrium_andersonii.AAC.1